MKRLYLYKNKGFTIIETLIYVAIFSIIVGALSSFVLSINSSRLRAQILFEVNDQGTNIVRIISQTIRNGQSINMPTSGSTAASLSVATANVVTNPTIFSVVDEILYITEGSGSPIALTNNKVKISNVIFTNLSRSGTPGVVEIRFTLSNIASAIKVEQQYAVDFYGTASIR